MFMWLCLAAPYYCPKLKSEAKPHSRSKVLHRIPGPGYCKNKIKNSDKAKVKIFHPVSKARLLSEGWSSEAEQDPGMEEALSSTPYSVHLHRHMHTLAHTRMHSCIHALTRTVKMCWTQWCTQEKHAFSASLKYTVGPFLIRQTSCRPLPKDTQWPTAVQAIPSLLPGPFVSQAPP